MKGALQQVNSRSLAREFLIGSRAALTEVASVASDSGGVDTSKNIHAK
jgi:hypothetical protein